MCSETIKNDERLDKLKIRKYPKNTNLIASLITNPDVQAKTLDFSFGAILELLNPDEYFSLLQASTYNEELLVDLTVNHASFDKLQILLSEMELLSSEKLQKLISKNILGSSRIQKDPKVRELLMKQIERVYSSQSIMELLSNIDPGNLNYSMVDIWAKCALKHSVDGWHEVFFRFDPRWKLVQKFFTFKTKQGNVKIKRLFKDFFKIIYDLKNINNHQLLLAFYYLKSSKAMKLFAKKFLLRSLEKVKSKTTASKIVNIVKNQLSDAEFCSVIRYGETCLSIPTVGVWASNFNNLRKLERTCRQVLTEKECKLLMWNRNYSKDFEDYLKSIGGGMSPFNSFINRLYPLLALVKTSFFTDEKSCEMSWISQTKNISSLRSGFLSHIKKICNALGIYKTIFTVLLFAMLVFIVFHFI